MSSKEDRTFQFSFAWMGASRIFSSNPKISIYVRDSIRLALGKLKDQRQFNELEKSKVIQWLKELNADKEKCPGLMNPTAEEYKQFVGEKFAEVDNEDRNGNVSIETSQKFREVGCYIGILDNFGLFDEEMQKLKKYCAAKAIDIFKSLKSGVQPKRGGFKETKKPDDSEFEKEIENMSNQMDNNFGCDGQNNYGFGNNYNNQGFSNPYGNQQQQNMGGYGNNQQMNNYNNNYNNNNNNNNNMQNHPNYNPRKKGIRLKFGGKKDKQEQDIAVGPRTTKVTDDPKNRGKKIFEFPNLNLSVQLPVRSKTIEYYKVIDNIKKVNHEGLRSVRKGRLKEALNYIEDSLEFLNYVQY